MRGVCGWLGGSARVSDPALTLHEMVRVFGLETAAPEADPRVAAAAVGPRSRVYRDGAILVALAGHPRLQGHEDPDDLLPQIVRIYRERPESLPAALQGAFALAILDLDAERALLAVDRIGVEALCYAQVGDVLVFASRADSVAVHPATPSGLDPQGVFNYLYFHCVPCPTGIYRGQRKLLPGQWVRFSRGQIQSGFYWSLGYRDHPAPFAPLKEEFLQILEQSVERASHGVEGASLGCFLSGGTDSSSVSGMLTRVQEQPARTFSIGFESEGYDEMEFVRIAERHFGLQSYHYYVTPEDVLEAIPRIAHAYDEPFGNASAIPSLFCAELAARNGVTTLLAGDGGDEIFAGNERYVTQLLFEGYKRIPGPLRNLLLEPLAFAVPGAERIMPLRKLGSYIRQTRIPLPDRMENYNFLHRNPLSDIFSGEFLASVDAEDPLENLREVYHRARTDSPLNRLLHLDMKLTLADNDLRKVCRMCELAGVEVRYPLLDEAMVEFSGRVPPGLKIRRMKLRYFFKRSLEGFLPKDILTKKKHGFGLPTGVWLRDHPGLHAHARQRLNELKQRDIVRPEYIDQLLVQHGQKHAHYYGVMVWVLMILEEWLQAHGL